MRRRVLAGFVLAMVLIGTPPAGAGPTTSTPPGLQPSGQKVLTEPPAESADPTTAADGVPMFSEVSGAAVAMDGTYTPVVGQFTQDLLQDIIWYSPTATDLIWVATGNRSAPFSSRTLSSQISGVYTPIVGDFSGSSRDDILWYRPGAATDSLWTTTSAAWTYKRLTINGTYEPLVAHRNSGPDPVRDAVLWLQQGQKAISIWSFQGNGSVSQGSAPFSGFDQSQPGRPRRVVAPLFNSFSNDDILWYGPGAAKDASWEMWGGSLSPGTYPYEQRFTLGGDYVPLAGDFRDPSCPSTGSTCMFIPTDDVLWLNETGPDLLWERDDGTWVKSTVDVPAGRATAIAGFSLCCNAGWESAATTVLVNPPTGPDSIVSVDRGGAAATRETGNTKIDPECQLVVGKFVPSIWQGDSVLCYRPGVAGERFYMPPRRGSVAG